MPLKSVLLDRKPPATARIPKRSIVVECPAGKPPKSLPPDPTPSDIPRLAETGNTVEQGRSLPRHSVISDGPSGKVAHSRDTSISENNAPKNLLSEPTPSSFLQLGETDKAAKQLRPLPPVPTDTEIALADFPWLLEEVHGETRHGAAQPINFMPPQNLTDTAIELVDIPRPLEEVHEETRLEAAQPINLMPPQNPTPYVAELTPLELAIVRHAAVAILCRSSLRNEIDLDQILEMLEVKRQRFWEKLFKPGNDRKKKGVLAHSQVGKVHTKLYGWQVSSGCR